MSVKLLSILMLIQMCGIHRIRSLSLNIYRGIKDSFYSEMKLPTLKNVDCHDDGYCYCKTKGSFNTFTFNRTSLSGKCVRDKNIITEKPGCYNFIDGMKFMYMGIINKSETCGNTTNQSCALDFTIKAPINTQHIACHINWTKSTQSSDGRTWNPVPALESGVFELTKILSTQLNLEITRVDLILRKFSGKLLRLEIDCSDLAEPNNSESHCALFKVVGRTIENISHVPTTVPATSKSYFVNTTKSNAYSPTPTSDSGMNNGLDTENDDDTSFILITVVVLAAGFGLLVIAVIMAVLYRRQKRIDTEAENSHIYQEPTFPTQNSGTTVQTSVLPDDSIYQVVDDRPRYDTPTPNEGTEDRNDDREQQSDGPFYHTLERTDDSQENGHEEGAYQALDEKLRANYIEPTYNEPVEISI